MQPSAVQLAVQLLAKAHQQVHRARTDFHPTVALTRIGQYDTLSHEDLQTAHLLRNHHPAKSIADAGWRAFLRILAFTAGGAGKRAVAVSPASTSQRCSGPHCGIIVAKGVSVRWHACPDCGTSLQRDHNAATNRESLGHRLRAAVASAAAENTASPGLSHGSVKTQHYEIPCIWFAVVTP